LFVFMLIPMMNASGPEEQLRVLPQKAIASFWL
jgi:hypothetical protein